MDLARQREGEEAVMTPAERVYARTRVEPNGCIVWTGGLTWGYGQISVNGKSQRVHRVTWQAVNGPVPEGLEMDHLCQNKACVNPDHLEAVTHAENNRRRPIPFSARMSPLVFRCGHPRSPENSKPCWSRTGGPGSWFACRTCTNAYKRRWKAARRAARSAA